MMSASQKVATRDVPISRRRVPSNSARLDSAQGDALAAGSESGAPQRRTELKRELQAIVLLLFGLFLADARVAVGIAAARAHCNSSAAVAVIGRLLVEPLVWLLGWR